MAISRLKISKLSKKCGIFWQKAKQDQNPPTTDDKLGTSLSANTIMAKLTNHVQQTNFITSLTDKYYSLDSEDDFRSGCWSPTTVLFRTTLTRTIKLYELLIILGSNHLLYQHVMFFSSIMISINCFDML